MGKVLEENEVHRDAFELYYSLGDYVSVRKKAHIVEEEFGIAYSTVFRWKDRFNWDDKKRLRDIENRKQIEAITNQLVVETRMDLFDVVKKSIQDYKERIDLGELIKISNTVDLDRMVKLCLLLIGDATERTETKGISVNMDRKKRAAEYEDYFSDLEEDPEEVDGESEEDIGE